MIKSKTYYPIEINDLRFQIDHITPKKTWLFDEYDDDPTDKIFKIILKKT